MAKPKSTWLSESEQRAWRAYVQMQSALGAQLNRRLQAGSGISIADYEVLVHLSEAPGGVLRVFELGRAIDWEKSRLSHHLRRMEARGLIERRECESDARGAFVVLTPEGRRSIEAAAPRHVEDVRRYVVDALSPAELRALGQIAERVLGALAERNEGEG